MSGSSVTIILPTYKEVESLPLLIDAVSEVRSTACNELTMIIVDDNSADGTEALIENLSLDWIELIIRKNDRGLSSAVIEGLHKATSEFCVVMDADGSHPAETIPAMLQALNEGADFVVGSRHVKGGETEDGWGVLRWLNSKVATLMARPFTNVLDPMSGFLAFRRATFQQATDINPVGYKIGLELIVKCQCSRVVEVPIHFSTRKHGQSKLTLRVQWEYMQHVVRLLKYAHPKLYSFCTFVAVGLSGALVYVGSLPVTTNLIENRWLAILLAVWIAMTWNFIWDRKYAFWYSRSRSILMHYFGFVCVCSVGATTNFFITNWLYQNQSILLAGVIGAVVGSMVGILFNFFVSRLLVFRK